MQLAMFTMKGSPRNIQVKPGKFNYIRENFGKVAENSEVKLPLISLTSSFPIIPLVRMLVGRPASLS